jgi:hypothetical protein
MPLDSQRPAWWRIPSPSMLLLVFIFSFLPWIEIGCENKVDAKNLFGGQAGATKVAVSTTGGKTVLATQSGFQIATGGHTEHNPLGESSKNADPGATAARGQLSSDRDGPAAAPLLFVFFLAVVTAIVAGFAMPPSRMRVLVVALSTGLAFVVLLIQSAILGFPAVNDVARKMKEAQAAQGVVGLDAGGLFVRYTIWYWLTWALLLSALVPLVVEEMQNRRKPAAPTLWH